ncbi:MAG: GNAT family N-acetyltransferase [bacterium]
MPQRVEQAEPRDFLAVAALDRIAWGEDGPIIADGEHVWRVWCEYATVLVVRRPGASGDHSSTVAGALVMFPTQQGELFLHKIMVHPDCRGQGTGTAMMKAALERAAAPVLLTVDPTNTRAVELYQRYGFTVREHVQGYYRQREDRYLMVHVPPINEAV